VHPQPRAIEPVPASPAAPPAVSGPAKGCKGRCPPGLSGPAPQPAWAQPEVRRSMAPLPLTPFNRHQLQRRKLQRSAQGRFRNPSLSPAMRRPCWGGWARHNRRPFRWLRSKVRGAGRPAAAARQGRPRLGLRPTRSRQQPPHPAQPGRDRHSRRCSWVGNQGDQGCRSCRQGSRATGAAVCRYQPLGLANAQRYAPNGATQQAAETTDVNAVHG